MPNGQNMPSPMIGAFVLETLTTGMYTNPLDALREYIQNAFDSIQEATRRGVLGEGAGRIEVKIDKKKRELRIHDNGIGITLSEATPCLVNIGLSRKSIEANAGFRGIGRLAGIAYAERLRFITQSSDERDLSTITFDCMGIRRAISPTMRQVEELSTVVSRHCNTEVTRSGRAEHFFEVVMEGIRPDADIFLDWQLIQTYLSQVAPVGFDTTSFLLAGTIHDWLKDRRISLPRVSAILRSDAFNAEVFKPYRKLTYKTKRDNQQIDVKGVRFYPEDAGPESPFWVWYAHTNLPGMFGDDTVAGLRLRKNNISLGFNERMSEIFSEVSDSSARFNSYLMGEVHIQDPAVIPNARRDGLEDSLQWLEIRSALVQFARERSKEIRDASSSRNMDIEKLLRPAEKEAEMANKKMETGLASKSERDAITDRIDKRISKLEAACRSDRSEDEKTRIRDLGQRLSAAKQDLENVASFTAQNLKSSLDKKQRKVVSEIISILYDVLDEDAFERARDAILEKYQVAVKEDNDS